MTIKDLSGIVSVKRIFFFGKKKTTKQTKMKLQNAVGKRITTLAEIRRKALIGKAG